MSSSNKTKTSSPVDVCEARLRRAVIAYIVTGLTFMLLPGTFLGVWNLVSVTSRRSLEGLSPAWIQAHGHAQIYGWIGTFIIGIGFHSLSKMGRVPEFAAGRAWVTYVLWTSGVTLRWFAGVTSWEWKIALPLSSLLELAGFLIFFATVSRHKSDSVSPETPRKRREPWMLVVVASTVGFLFALWLNVFAAFHTASTASTPAVSHLLDQRMLAVPVWTFLVPTVWGFNARWLPAFIGLRAPNGRKLLCATGLAWLGTLLALGGYAVVSACLLASAAALAALALHIFERTVQSVAVFIRLAWAWLLAAGLLTIWAAAADHSGGIWGASRHAVTVGFLAAMIFTIGPKILPAFYGSGALFSKKAMFASQALLNFGCLLRVSSEIPAYEGFAGGAFFWHILPCSAIVELIAVTLFAANLFVTFLRPSVLGDVAEADSLPVAVR
jgi:uncharacterized protein involved in response to NO